MIKFLRKILYIQTLKIVLINPDNISIDGIRDVFKHLPIVIIVSYKIDDVKVIDTGIPVKKKNERQS